MRHIGNEELLAEFTEVESGKQHKTGQTRVGAKAGQTRQHNARWRMRKLVAAAFFLAAIVFSCRCAWILVGIVLRFYTGLSIYAAATSGLISVLCLLVYGLVARSEIRADIVMAIVRPAWQK